MTHQIESPDTPGCLNVTGVFISHASDDKALVDGFTDTLIGLGCGASKSQNFYTSGEDTGVPSGADLLHHVREVVADSALVVAIVTPTYQTRSVCIAELAAAWSRTGNLFPIALPGMLRTDMEGVLAGMTVRLLDEEAALDELHDRVCKVLGTTPKAATWSRHKAKWLQQLKGHLKNASPSRTVSSSEVVRLETDVATLREALAEVSAENVELEARLEAMAEAVTADDVAEVMLPKDESKRFAALRKATVPSMGNLPRVVCDALRFELDGGEMPWPHAYEESDRFREVQEAVDDGLLTETGNDQLRPNHDFPDIEDASHAVADFAGFLQESSSEFRAWFRRQYRVPALLEAGATWRELTA